MSMAELRDLPTDAARNAKLDDILDGAAVWDEAALGELVTVNQPTLRTFLRSVALPHCDWELDWELGPETPVAHLPKARALGRLAALAAVRSYATGNHAAAVHHWAAGVTFATHIAQEGSLISVLTGRAILAAHLRTVRQAVADGALPSVDAARLRASIALLPAGAFAWDAAINREAGSVDRLVRQLRAAPDPRSTYQVATGGEWPDGASLPNDTDLRLYIAFMEDFASALRESPQRGAAQLGRLEEKRTRLQPLLRDWVPVVSRVLASRADLETDRIAALAVLSGNARQ
jgi:hypothetical protein